MSFDGQQTKKTYPQMSQMCLRMWALNPSHPKRQENIMKRKNKVILVALASLYLISYLGFRVSNEIMHIENKSEGLPHVVKAQNGEWDHLLEGLSTVASAKSNIYNYTYFPLRKIEELLWNISTTNKSNEKQLKVRIDSVLESC